MRVFLYIITLLGGLAALFQLFDTMVAAESAPQQAAGAAFALAYVVIPYCMARAYDEMVKPFLGNQKASPENMRPMPISHTTPVKASSATPVTLYCPDCAEAGMQINLWDVPDGRSIGQVPHDTPAIELGRRTINGNRFVQVQTETGLTGWLAASLVRSR